jgi:hypothetical protein
MVVHSQSLMKLKNFTDLNAWAVEQWGDAELGDSRRTDRAYAVGAAIAANPEARRKIHTALSRT